MSYINNIFKITFIHIISYHQLRLVTFSRYYLKTNGIKKARAYANTLSTVSQQDAVVRNIETKK